jgi:hypothetical protein
MADDLEERNRLLGGLAEKGGTALVAAIMFLSTTFATICFFAALLSLVLWGDLYLPLLIPGLISSGVATVSSIYLFRVKGRWP